MKENQGLTGENRTRVNVAVKSAKANSVEFLKAMTPKEYFDVVMPFRCFDA